METDVRDSERELMTVAEVAEYLRCSERFVRSKIYAGEIPSHRLGKKILRIRRVDVERYVAES